MLPNQTLYDRAKLLRWFGIDRQKRSTKGDFRLEHDITEAGFKYHMNDLNATIGLANLEHVDTILSFIRLNAAFYRDKLKDCRCIRLLSEVGTPSYWIYTLRVVLPGNKAQFIEYMSSNVIQVSSVHQRNDIHSCLASYVAPLPKLDVLEKEYICIPVGWWVDHIQREYIVDSILEWDSRTTYTILPLYDIVKGGYRINIDDVRIELLALYQQLNGLTLCHDNDTFVKKVHDMHSQDGHVYVLLALAPTLKVVGTAKLIVETKFYDTVCHIEDVVVDYDQRHLGYGKALIDHILKQIKELYPSTYKVILNCNTNVLPFYEKCGFILKGYECCKYLK